MNREAIIRASFFMAKALGKRTSRREVNEIISKLTGKGFRPAEVAVVLASLREPLRNQHGTSTEPASVPKMARSGTSTGTMPEPATLIPVLDNYSKPTVSSKPPRLDTRTESEKVADTALAALRESIEPSLKAGTWTGWKARNRKATIEMARAGMTAEQIVGVATSWRTKKGRDNIVMAWVAEWVEGGGGKAARGRDCPGCELTPAECERLHNDPNDIYQNYYELEA